VNCPQCGAAAAGPDRFCESCGSPLDACRALTDHRQTDLGPAAAISDRGRQRKHNEDAYAIAAFGDHLLAVVCDGVASTDGAGPAAEAAAGAAIACLTAGASTTPDWSTLAGEAVAAAQEAVRPAGGTPALADVDGSTTLALALARAGEIVVANVGDSRVYWIGDDGQTVLLSVDDSWDHFAREAGLPDAEVRDPARRHEITAWLGPDAEPVVPHLARHAPEGGGLLLLCSDGLWNYAESPDAMGALVTGAGDRRPGAVALHLVRAAIDAGGADNVTVAVLAHPGQPPDGVKGGVGDEHV
jgi:PPM family protein phosphatase